MSAMTFAQRAKQRQEDRKVFDAFGYRFNESSDAVLCKIDDYASELKTSIEEFQRRIVGSPYERLTFAQALLDMCEADAAELLNKEIDPLTFDDVLTTVERLADKVRALKARAELPSAAE